MYYLRLQIGQSASTIRMRWLGNLVHFPLYTYIYTTAKRALQG